MLESVECLLDVTWHGDIDGVVNIVPEEGKAEVV